MTNYDNDDERPSWREIDKKRDRSAHVDHKEKGTAERPGAGRWDTGRQKQALEKLLKGDKGTIEHDKLHNRIHKSYGMSTFLTAVKNYIETYGPPDDMSTLLLLLDSKDESIMELTMIKLKTIYGGLSVREKEDVRRKLSILALTDRSIDIRETASEILEDLKTD
jgi:hypothetical protein